MSIEIRTPGADDVAATFRADGRAFGFTYAPEEIAERLTTMDLDRFRIAVDGSDVVGIIGSYAFDVTVPGGTTVPMGGVTWVSVATTHRRHGLLGRLMNACHDDIDQRGEPVAMLTASEGAIYERFGYGIGTQSRVVSIDRRQAQLRPEFVPAPGSVRFIEADDALAHVAALWERFRRTRAGEVTRSAAWQQSMFDARVKPLSELTPALYLAHADGYAIYRVAGGWNDGHPAHRLEVVELVAVTAEAHAALWHSLLGVDLVGVIRSRQLPVDESLPFLLTNPRQMRTTDLNDGIWVNVRDVTTSFGARHYATTDRLVVEVDGERYAIEGGADGGSCTRVRTRSDLVATRAALGALLLGGTTATALVRGGRLTARNADAQRRADVFFTTAVAPHCQTMY